MKSRRISWFWPFSFLAALGQVLLLVTGNDGGPSEARFALALWTLWIPGVWLGNLLTKPRTGLLARIPLQTACALAIAYLALQLSLLGLIPHSVLPLALSGLSTLVAGAFLFLPEGPPDRRQTRYDARNDRPAEPAVLTLFGLLVLVVAGLQLWAGSPLSLRADGVDHVASVARALETAFPLGAYDPGAGSIGFDPHRSLVPSLLHLVSGMSAQAPHVLWDLLPAVAAPLFLLAFFAFARVIFPNESLAVLGTLVCFAMVTEGLSNDALRLAGYPDRLALIPLWVSLGLFVEGLDRPHPRIGIALAMSSLATVGTHLGAGWLLALGMLTIGTFTWTSVDRFLEGIPLLAVLWLPALCTSGAYLLVRAATLGSLAPAGVPAQGLFILDPGLWTLDPGRFGRSTLAAGLFAVLFLPVLFRDAWSRITTYTLVSLTVLVVCLGFNPWIFPDVERGAGSWVHFLPWLAPVPLVLVGLARWALIGLAKSQGLVWLRFLIVGVCLGLVVSVSIQGISHPRYTLGALGEAHPEDPSRWAAAAESLAVVSPDPAVVVAPPFAARAIAAHSPLRSALEPLSTNRPAEAYARWASVRDVLGLHGEREADTLLVLDLMRELAANVAVLTEQPDSMAYWNAPSRTHPAPGFRVIPVPRVGEAWIAEDALSPSVAPLPAPTVPRIPVAGGPALLDVSPDARRVQTGGRLGLRAQWRPRDARDRSSYRARVELVQVKPDGGVASWSALVTQQLSAWLTGSARECILETEWHPGANGFQDFLLQIPLSLEPGWYSLRVGLLRGDRGPNRLRAGLDVLPAATPSHPVQVVAPGDLDP